MKVTAAIVKEQQVTFAVISVARGVVDQRHRRDDAQRGAMMLFRGVPVVLMGEDSSGQLKCYGRDDIVRFLGSVHPDQLPWREFDVNV